MALQNGESMFFINQLPKNVVFKLDMESNDFDRDFGVLVLLYM
jgi:hypothetical protein